MPASEDRQRDMKRRSLIRLIRLIRAPFRRRRTSLPDALGRRRARPTAAVDLPRAIAGRRKKLYLPISCEERLTGARA